MLRSTLASMGARAGRLPLRCIAPTPRLLQNTTAPSLTSSSAVHTSSLTSMAGMMRQFHHMRLNSGGIKLPTAPTMTTTMNSSTSTPHSALQAYRRLIRPEQQHHHSHQVQVRHRVSRVYIKKSKAFRPPKKLKTKAAIKKRFRITGHGVLLRRMAGKQHHSWAKGRRKTGKLGVWVPIEGGMRKKILKLMGHCKTYK